MDLRRDVCIYLYGLCSCIILIIRHDNCFVHAITMTVCNHRSSQLMSSKSDRFSSNRFARIVKPCLPMQEITEQGDELPLDSPCWPWNSFKLVAVDCFARHEKLS
jgi:hypothetical protein